MVHPSAAQFTPYGASHFLAVLVLVLGAVALVVVGRRRRDADPDDRMGKVFAAVVVVVTLLPQLIYFTPAHFNPYAVLPLQLCDLASLASIYALWTHRWWAVALTYFWGLFLTTQAIATPDLRPGFPDPDFLIFWAMHISTVWAAAYLAWGRGILPGWRGYRFTVALTAGWVVAVYSLNVVLDANYGYLNRRPEAPTVLDVLGPWPWYLFAEIVIIAVVWTAATWIGTRGSDTAVPAPDRSQAARR